MSSSPVTRRRFGLLTAASTTTAALGAFGSRAPAAALSAADPPPPSGTAGGAAAGTEGTEGTAVAASGDATPGGVPWTSSVPFVSGEEGYDTFRIPAILTTGSGTVLAFAEGRVGGSSDTGNIDVVVKRSGDGGRTWGPLILVAAGQGDTRGNPAPVVDPGTGRIVLLTVFNAGDAHEDAIMRGEVPPEDSRRPFVQFSDDDGQTFSAPREITGQVKPQDWRWYATGPGHAVALRHGGHAGRLVVPANHSAAPPPGSGDLGDEWKYAGGHSLYSDDGGETWHIGFVDGDYDGVVNANESIAAELPDGRLYFNSRDQHGTAPGARVDAYSQDGGETLLAPYAPQTGLAEVPVVQGSVLQVAGDDAGGEAPLLFSGPSDPGERVAMALWRSDDQGRTFSKALTLSERRAAYSDLVQLGPDAVGVLYETGVDSPYETIELRRVPLRDL